MGVAKSTPTFQAHGFSIGLYLWLRFISGKRYAAKSAKGSGTWGEPRGVQACARLQQLLEWTRSAGFGEAGERFFRKLSCTLDLLATPSAQLIQVGAPRREPAGTVWLGSGASSLQTRKGSVPAVSLRAALLTHRQGHGPGMSAPSP